MASISVVVPTKDRLRYLRKAVPIYLAHDEVAEVIVVIDGCQDGTLEYVRALAARESRVRFIDNVVNGGLPFSRNRGVELAAGEYIFTGEDDLELTEGFFGVLLSHLRDTNADIISGRNIFRAETESAADAISRTDSLAGDAVDRRAISVQTGIAARADQEQLLLPAPMLGRTAIFREIPFDEGYAVNYWREESDFQLAALARGYKLVFCPHAISFNLMIENDRGGAHSVAGLKRVKWVVKNNWRFIRKHRQVISREFDIGRPAVYIARFAVKRVYLEVLAPLLVEAKHRAMAAATGRRRSATSQRTTI